MNLNRLMPVLVLAATGLGCNQQPQVTPVSAAAPARPQRYQVFFSPHVRADTFLVDTQKGRVWVLTKFTDIPNEPSAFDEVDVIDNTGDVGMPFSEFLRIYASPQAAASKSKKSKSPAVSDYPIGKSSEPKTVKK